MEGARRLISYSKQMSFKMAMEGRDRGRMSNIKWDAVPNGWGCYMECTRADGTGGEWLMK